MSLFRVIAFVLFVIAAVLCFTADGIALRTDLGLVAGGLAALAISGGDIDRKIG